MKLAVTFVRPIAAAPAVARAAPAFCPCFCGNSSAPMARCYWQPCC